jgi:hypothetical protein
VVLYYLVPSSELSIPYTELVRKTVPIFLHSQPAGASQDTSIPQEATLATLSFPSHSGQRSPHKALWLHVAKAHPAQDSKPLTWTPAKASLSLCGYPPFPTHHCRVYFARIISSKCLQTLF